MTGMKIQIAIIKSYGFNNMKISAVFFLLMALGVAAENPAQELVKNTNPPSIAAPVPGITDLSSVKSAGKMPQPGAIEDVQVTTENGQLVVTILTNRLIAPNEFKVENPPRLVLDFYNAENRVQFTRLPINAASVKRLRVQQHQSLPHMIARVVFDLEEDFVDHDIILDKTFVRIVFHPNPSKTGDKNSNRDPKTETSENEVKASPAPPPPMAVMTSAGRDPIAAVAAAGTSAPHFVDSSVKVPMPSRLPLEAPTVNPSVRSSSNTASPAGPLKKNCGIGAAGGRAFALRHSGATQDRCF